MEENRVVEINKEKTDALKEAYKDILDAYDHQTLARPEGTYYDGDESIEEVDINNLTFGDRFKERLLFSSLINYFR